MGNPLKYSDPTGHSPASDYDTKIRLRDELWRRQWEEQYSRNGRSGPSVLKGWRRHVDKDPQGNEIVSYSWWDNPNVHDVPDYYQYVDTKGRIIVLNGLSATNWHTWGVLNLDGSITPGDDKANMTPAGYTRYGMVRSSLTGAGYHTFFDPHKDHRYGVNFMTYDSPTLNVTVRPDGGCIVLECKGPEPFESQRVTSDAHLEKYNPHSQFFKHQLFEVIPNALGRIF
jgi:hypothetical protein